MRQPEVAVIMLASMTGIYKDRRKNRSIFVGSALLVTGELFLARSQATVHDVAWMKAMMVG